MFSPFPNAAHTDIIRSESLVNYTFGFIGTGNMGGAVAIAAAKQVAPEKIALANRTPEKAQTLAQRLGCAACDNETVARNSRFIFLGVKPHVMSGLLNTLRPAIAERSDPPILVSMAAGLTIDQIRTMAGRPCPVIRMMPNTPVAIGAGVILYDSSEDVTEKDITEFSNGMKGAGRLWHLEESLMDAGSAVAGCGPAFAYLFIDAMADGGVACGLSRKDALDFAAQTVLGAAKMILNSHEHPDQLKNEVCSPGGSTIQGVRTLEQRAVRSAAMDAVIAAFEKTKDLGKDE